MLILQPRNKEKLMPSASHELERRDEIDLLNDQIKQLKEDIQLAEMLNDASIDRIMAFDLDLRIIAWNKTCERVSGFTKEQVLGKKLLEIYPEINELPALLDAIDSAMHGYKVYVPSDKGSFKGGHYEHHFMPLKNKHGVIIGVMNVIHDVAHRVKAERELKSLNKSLAKKNKELKLSNAELTSFSHVTSHDLKEPLRKAYLFLEMITKNERERLSEEGKAHFKKAQAALQRMTLLTDDILTFAQLQVKGAKQEEIDLNDILKFTKNNLREMISAKKAEIRSQKLPVINGYRSMVVQLFQNILSNALKFQEAEAIPSIKISATSESADNIKHPDAVSGTDYFRISFHDNGIGFEKKYGLRVFQMFHKLHDAEQYPGTGIGLAVCKKIMDLHQGFITVESEPGVGSCFHCYFPLE